MQLLQNASDLGSTVILGSLSLFRALKIHGQIIFDVMKTNSLNVTQFSYMEPMYMIKKYISI